MWDYYFLLRQWYGIFTWNKFYQFFFCVFVYFSHTGRHMVLILNQSVLSLLQVMWHFSNWLQSWNPKKECLNTACCAVLRFSLCFFSVSCFSFDGVASCHFSVGDVHISTIQPQKMAWANSILVSPRNMLVVWCCLNPIE